METIISQLRQRLERRAAERNLLRRMAQPPSPPARPRSQVTPLPKDDPRTPAQ